MHNSSCPKCGAAFAGESKSCGACGAVSFSSFPLHFRIYLYLRFALVCVADVLSVYV
ncbi:hypothetical protein F5Y14DRAFT_402858 [Nemania sp. NC0429]|nr:hypothetical protein F5Y14DRAFT_402858 [Nemania sp. NC0429]